ncbi:MAG: hypothetical protein VXY54_09800 [Pseudomonadota bacterium]|nr:hypothetical protein [Pseudomonadota bacterium]
MKRDDGPVVQKTIALHGGELFAVDDPRLKFDIAEVQGDPADFGPPEWKIQVDECELHIAPSQINTASSEHHQTADHKGGPLAVSLQAAKENLRHTSFSPRIHSSRRTQRRGRRIRFFAPIQASKIP